MDNQVQEITKEINIPIEKLEDIKNNVQNVECLKNFLNQNISNNITDLTGIVLAGSAILGASDIHFEPGESNIKFRLRLDGVLNDVFLFNEKIYRSILSRIKLLSGLKLNITDRAQDGRFSIVLGESEIEVRVSSLPSEYGESVVMRILDPKSLITTQTLGIRPDMQEVFEKQIKQPNGMIVVTGPTGSGKTTTLYAILKKIQNPEIKIITIEDPIEYHLEGISQSQVNPKKGYSFSTGLEAIVRQDPDVILVGEIRDSETAKIALQASLTGHLVLTTLHTNDATGTIVRLMALGEKPVNIAPAINLAIGQRLVRKICPHCHILRPVSSMDISIIKKELSDIDKEIKRVNNLPEITEKLKIPQAQGCDKCNQAGFKGRVGVFEFFVVDDELENFIAKSPNIAELKQKAKNKGMLTMKQDGVIKVLQNITTLEEVLKTVGE